MSCAECEQLQASEMTSFFRWGPANVEIRGCPKHLREVFEALSSVQAVTREGPRGGPPPRAGGPPQPTNRQQS